MKKIGSKKRNRTSKLSGKKLRESVDTSSDDARIDAGKGLIVAPDQLEKNTKYSKGVWVEGYKRWCRTSCEEPLSSTVASRRKNRSHMAEAAVDSSDNAIRRQEKRDLVRRKRSKVSADVLQERRDDRATKVQSITAKPTTWFKPQRDPETSVKIDRTKTSRIAARTERKAKTKLLDFDRQTLIGTTGNGTNDLHKRFRIPRSPSMIGYYWTEDKLAGFKAALRPMPKTKAVRREINLAKIAAKKLKRQEAKEAYAS